ncbi:MAG: TVP38/TMEM64 family protein [Clostridia bacterium]|nr:TVP38/TMEM64 family protein [Clostridia bacterium]
MRKVNILSLLSEILFTIAIFLFGTLFIVFLLLYIENYYSIFYVENEKTITTITASIMVFASILIFYFLRTDKKLLAKCIIFAVILISIVSVSAFLLKASGFLDKINDTNKLREYVSGYGNNAAVLFIIIQFLQVVILPVPSFITIATGVLLFGSLKCAVYSSIGIISGSIVSYFIGRKLGYKAICRFFGKNKVDKIINKIKGKDKLLFTAMFILPFFPDDLLCFIAGLTSITPAFFIIMIIITRIITVFTSAFSINNQLIPYNTWWGICIWILLFIIVFLAWKIINKYGTFIKCKNTDNC